MPDLPRNTLTSPEPAPRVLTLRRRLASAALGAVGGGMAGWLAALIGGVHGVMHWWVAAGLAVLAAALGYRYGRSVVQAIFMSFVEAGDGR